METTAKFKASLKKQKELLKEEIILLKSNVMEYKKERKIEWKEFKTNTSHHIDKIEKKLEVLNEFIKK